MLIVTSHSVEEVGLDIVHLAQAVGSRSEVCAFGEDGDSQR